MNIQSGYKAAKLFTKSIGNTTKGGIKLEGNKGLSMLTPQEAISFDVVEGVGKKGQFSLYAFKDKDGHTIQHYTRYLDDEGKATDVITDIDTSTNCYNVTRKTINAGNIDESGKLIPDGTVKETYYTSLVPQISPVDNQIVFSKSFMKTTQDGDFGGLELLQKGKIPHGINYKYNWDGTPAEINYRNTLGQKLDITETESRYLPFVNRQYHVIEQNGQPALITTDFTQDRLNEQIGLAQIIQEKLHGIEGVMPRAKGVQLKDLHLIKTSGKTPEQWIAEKGFVVKGESLGNGQINIAIDVPEHRDGVILLDLISHEMQHNADYIKMYRGGAEATNEALKKVGITLEEFNTAHKAEFNGIDGNAYIKKVIEKFGLAKKGTPEYDESVKFYEENLKASATSKLKSAEQHDEMFFEQRAIEREKEQINFYTQVCLKLGNFISTFLGK